jgi:dihydrofolate synthase/folylpolyglutamate synthase
MSSYEKTIRYLYSLAPSLVKPGLRRTERLVALLGAPQLHYPCVLVGGTNGKGSTSAMIATILKEAGYRTALYTSPHLERFNERIRVNGEPIANKDIVRIARRLKSLVENDGSFDGDAPSFFEFTTAMALEYFRQRKVELAVCEVGMGGRLDSTNILHPLVSVVTTINYDHTQYLGRTLKAIAREKAGIIKEGGFAVVGVANPVLYLEARRKGAEIYILGRDFAVEPSGGHFDYRSPFAALSGLTVNLRGEHQLRNAACAIKTCEVLSGLGYSIGAAAIKRGLKKVFWPGRFEVVRKNPTVILDCAHNPEGAAALSRALDGFGKITLVFGVMADKDIEGIMAQLFPLAHTVVVAAPRTKRSASAAALLKKAKKYATSVFSRKTVSEACAFAMKNAERSSTICVSGSIFTVAEARRWFLGPNARTRP